MDERELPRMTPLAARPAPRLRRRATPPPEPVVRLARLALVLRKRPLAARLLRSVLLVALGLALTGTAAWADVRLHRGVETGGELPPVRQLTGRDLATNADLTRFAPDQLPEVATALQSSGFRYVRQTFSWADLEPAQGDFRWDRADAIVDELVRRGITPIAVLHRSPSWSRAPDAAAAFDAPPTDPDAFARFVQAFVGRYGDRVPFVQLWDLPNRPDHWGGAAAEPNDYLGLLAVGFNAARSANPNVSVVLAECDPDPDAGAMGDLAFLRGLYAAGAAPFFDVVAVRVDGGTRSPFDQGVAAGAPSLSRATLVRDLLLDAGDATKPVWATHYGWRTASPGISPEEQAAFTLAGIRRARAEWPWMGPLFLWGLAPGPSLGGDVDPGDALLRADGSSTPLLTAIGAYGASGATDVAPTGFLPVGARQFVYEGNWDRQHLGEETYQTTSEVGARLSVRFAGTGAVARVRLSRQAGALDATLDGKPLAIDLDAFQAADVDVPLARGLPDGVHELVIRLKEPGQFTIGGLVVERTVPLRWPIALLLGSGIGLLFAGVRDLVFALAERSGRIRPRPAGDFFPDLPLLPGWRPARRA